jgi:hypothetical protein
VRRNRTLQNMEKNQVWCDERDRYHRQHPATRAQSVKPIQPRSGHIAAVIASTNCNLPNPTGPLFTQFSPLPLSMAMTSGKLTRPL